MKIKIGTRASPLALAQTEIIAREILKFYPEAEISIIKIKTSGDKNMSPFSSDPAGRESCGRSDGGKAGKAL